MSATSILNEQFDACFNQSAWFASAKSALENLSNEDAVWKANGDVHSVCEIVSHLNFYNHKHLQRFKEIKVANETLEIAKTYSNENWQAALEEFNAIMFEWKQLLENSDDAKFSSKWSSIIAHINIHNAYHIGQIVVVRKLRNNWDSSFGIR